MNNKFEGLRKQIEGMNKNVKRLDKQIEGTSKKVERLESKLIKTKSEIKNLINDLKLQFADEHRPMGAPNHSKDVNQPKLALSPFNHFKAQCRKEAAKAGKPRLKLIEFTKETSDKWKALSLDKKKPFEAAAAEDKKRYEMEMRAYKGKSLDPKTPTRPPTAYSVFLADFRTKNKNKGIGCKELRKMAGKEWKTVSKEDKKSYRKRALEESKKCESAMTEYKRTGGPPAKKARVDEADEEEEDEEDEEEEDKEYEEDEDELNDDDDEDVEYY